MVKGRREQLVKFAIAFSFKVRVSFLWLNIFIGSSSNDDETCDVETY